MRARGVAMGREFRGKGKNRTILYLVRYSTVAYSSSRMHY